MPVQWLIPVVLCTALSGCGVMGASSRNTSPAPRQITLALEDLLTWLVDELNLKSGSFQHFRITHLRLSPDQHYAVIRLSSGSQGSPPGPLYRFVLCALNERRILYPEPDSWKQTDLGYPCLAERFSADSRRCALVVGYRELEARLIVLPSGTVVRRASVPPGSDLNVILNRFAKER